MKKSLFLIPFATLAFASCSDKDLSGNNEVVTDGSSNYISVNIVNANALTRDDADPDYEYGLDEENAVDPESVTFFFFYEDGSVAPVKANGDYYYTPAKDQIVQGEGDGDNTASIINAILVINAGEGDLLPDGIVAILNPSDEIKDILNGTRKISNVDDLLAEVQDFSIQSTGKFVMTNSIYMDETGKHIKATPILPEHYRKTAEEAQQNENAVNIFVERVVAKVTVTNELEKEGAITLEDATLYNTGVTYNNGEGQQPVYVKLYNWNVTATINESFLVKNIDTTWDSNLFGDPQLNPWNKPGDFRSFWAINPSSLVENEYGKYEDANIFGYESPNNFTYIQENAWDDYANYDPESPDPSRLVPTEVIIAAQLVDEDGNPLGLADVGGVKYVVDCLEATDESPVKPSNAGKETIKKAQLAYLNPSIWNLSDISSEGKISTISTNDVEVYSGQEMRKINPEKYAEAKDYRVYLQLTAEAEKKLWNTDSQATTGLLVDEINNILFQLGGAKVWTAGLTYYYVPLRHLGSKENSTGYYGVVRNHVYKLTLNTLIGLGTPVYNPEETIYPQHPDKDETYIGAKINVLSWKIVPQGVELKW